MPLWVEISLLKSYRGIKFFEIAYFFAKIYVDISIPEFWFADILQLFSCLLGETRWALVERCAEHFNDAENFSKKSHMVSHLMYSHWDLNILPPFTFKIRKSQSSCQKTNY